VINGNFRPEPVNVVLIHAAPSGVGLLLVQCCKYLCGMVISTVGLQAKVGVAQSLGCDHTILYQELDFTATVKDIISKGVATVLDGVSKDAFTQSIHCTRRTA